MTYTDYVWYATDFFDDVIIGVFDFIRTNEFVTICILVIIVPVIIYFIGALIVDLVNIHPDFTNVSSESFKVSSVGSGFSKSHSQSFSRLKKSTASRASFEKSVANSLSASSGKIASVSKSAGFKQKGMFNEIKGASDAVLDKIDEKLASEADNVKTTSSSGTFKTNIRILDSYSNYLDRPYDSATDSEVTTSSTYIVE